MSIESRGRPSFVLAGAIAAVLLWAGIAASAAQQLPPGGGPIPPVQRGADGEIEVVPPSARPPAAVTSPNAGARRGTFQPGAASPEAAPKPNAPAPAAASTAKAPVALSADHLPTAGNGVLVAPKVVQPSQMGDIVGMRLQNAGATTEKTGYVTFGQPFLDGAVKPTDTLVARINGVNDAVQMDVKSTNADGSVRHAVLTLRAPAIAGGGSVDLMLAKGTAAGPSLAAPSASALLTNGYGATVKFTFHNPDGTTATYNASAAAALKAALSAGTVQNWLAGTLVNEYDVLTTVDGGKLKVEFDIRVYADGATTTDVIFDNSWMFSPGKTDLNYDVAISQGGGQVFSASSISHYLYSVWHRQVDSAGIINPNVQFDVPNLLRAGALPAYDLTLGVSGAAIQKNLNKLNAANTGPLGTAGVNPDMPRAGGRSDIGPEPNWVAQWLLSQTPASRKVMMANADASGGVPWHFTDENTSRPINGQTYPKFMDIPAATSAMGLLVPINGWPTYEKNGDPWKPDPAHMPDLNYVPYLVTGSRYQLDLLQAQGNFAITRAHPDYSWRKLDPSGTVYLGLSAPANEQRGIAWSLRNLAEAAYITPDNDPLKAYFSSELNLTMKGFVQLYITDGVTGPYGEIQGFILGIEPAGIKKFKIIAPWQQGYIVSVFAEVAAMNLPGASSQAVQMLRYMSNFIAGLYTNGANGYNPLNGPTYWLYVNDPTTGAPYTTWAQLYQGNLADANLNKSGWGLKTADPPTFPNSATDMDSGYPIIAKAALASIITYTQSPAAIQAYDYVVSQIAQVWSRTSRSQTAAWQTNPEWNVVPGCRMASGCEKSVYRSPRRTTKRP